jgi:MIP family channel proteins
VNLRTRQWARREPPALAVPLPHRLAAEAVGTALLVFFGPGAAVISAYRDGAITLEGVAAANGVIVMALIYSVGHISGAHFNPAVTLAFALFRHFQPREIAPYIAAQCTGAIAGSLLLWALFGNAIESGVTQPSGSDAQAFGMEIVLTFALMYVIMAVATDARAVGQAAAIAIGATVFIDVLIGGPISGGSMNPARSLGPAVVSGEIADYWIYLLAPLVGSVIGALAYTAVRGDHDQ